MDVIGDKKCFKLLVEYSYMQVMWWLNGLSVLVSGLSGPGLSAGRGHCVVFLHKTLNSHSTSALHPGVLMGTGEKMLWGNLRWTGIPSRGSGNTPSRLYAMETLWQCGPVVGPSAASSLLHAICEFDLYCRSPLQIFCASVVTLMLKMTITIYTTKTLGNNIKLDYFVIRQNLFTI